jgi:hypothetical protein
MLRRLVSGGGAGLMATVPMSGVIWGANRLGIYRNSPPPDAVSARLVQRVSGRQPAGGPPQRVLTIASHAGFGAGAGALYGASAQGWPPSVETGVLFGLALWLVSYRGWIPTLGLMPPPEQDAQGRTMTMIAAHLVYGATLGWMARRFQSSS